MLLMSHVLFNLIKNSLYFIAKVRKGNITITVSSGAQQNTLLFKDTATGIPADKLPNMFKKFYSESDEGNGIGLHFCKNVIDAFHGQITCDSIEGEYTEFKLIFPKESEKI